MQAHTLADVFAFGILVALHLNSIRFSFDKLNFYRTVFDRLCRQNCTTGKVTIIKIQLVDFIHQLVQILDANLFTDIFVRQLLQLCLLQYSGFIKLQLFQLKGHCSLLLCIRLLAPLLYLAASLSLVLSNLSGNTLALHILYSSVGCHTGVIQATFIEFCFLRRCRRCESSGTASQQKRNQ